MVVRRASAPPQLLVLRPILLSSTTFAIRVASLAPALALALVAIPAASGVETATQIERRESSSGRTPAIFVPGVTGTQLRDPASQELIWGGGRQMLRPHDGGYALAMPLDADDPQSGLRAAHPQDRYDPVEPMWVIKVFGWKKEIYQPLAEFLVARGYRLGELSAAQPLEDLFFFLYDWRHSNVDSAASLHSQLSALAGDRGPSQLGVDLICQSNAAKICRYLVKYGPASLSDAESDGPRLGLPYRIRKVILIGASNGGSLRAFEQLHNGRRHVPGIGRKLLPEAIFTARPMLEDLPNHRGSFFDSDGKAVEADLFRAADWVRYGWSIFSQEAQERVAKRPDLFGSKQDQVAFLERQLRRSARLQALLSRDAPEFGSPRYYLLENDSQPTIAGALLVADGERWRTHFSGDRTVDGSPLLHRLAAQPGDGHATLASQRDLSPQELDTVAGSATFPGGHFEMMIAEPALRRLAAFLED